MKKIYFLLIVVISGVVMTFVFAESKTTDSKTSEKAKLGFSEKAESTPAGKTVIHDNVTSAPVQAVSEGEKLQVTGSLAAYEKSAIASNVAGIVKKTLVERGSIVKKGDVMVQLDSEDAEIDLDEGKSAVEELKSRLGITSKESFNIAEQPEVKSAKAGFELAEADYNRYKDLFEKKVISRAEYDRFSTEFKTAKEKYDQTINQIKQLYQTYKTSLIKLRSLEKAVDDTKIRAPYSGFVAQRYVSAGERVTTSGMGDGAKILDLLKIDILKLNLTVPQQEYSRIKEGQAVEFTVEGLPGKKYAGKIKNINPALDQASRSLTVEAIVDNANLELRPGAFVSAEIQLGGNSRTFYVPKTAVKLENESSSVFVIQNGTAKKQIVSVGAAEGDRIRVFSGVSEGDYVILNPEGIKDGEKVF